MSKERGMKNWIMRAVAAAVLAAAMLAAGSAPAAAATGDSVYIGTVINGNEEGCRLLVNDADGREYLLVGVTPRLKAGSRMLVVGHVDWDVVSSCQQGAPLVYSWIGHI